MTAINNHQSKLDSLLQNLKPYADLVPHGFNELSQADAAFTPAAQEVATKDRELRIAVVGQVKAGKSSFLNALLFNGDELLPKAITPKTAALTIISYGEKLRAEVEFYDADEWRQVTNSLAECNQLIVKIREKHRHEQQNRGASLLKPQRSQPVELTDEQIIATGEIPEVYLAARELVRMVKKAGITAEDYLGKTISLEADDPALLSEKLNEYVGASGRFTPLVKYSRLFYNHPALEGVEIIDTPGLNDPVLSRGQLTRKFLARCDVAFVLSMAVPFLDQSDMNLLHEQLPEAGVRKVLLVASRFDMPLRGERHKHATINDLIDNLEGTIRKRAEMEFGKRLQIATVDSEQRMYRQLLESVKNLPCISARAYSAGQHFSGMSHEEKETVDRLNSLYPDQITFDAETLLEFSNMGDESPVRSTLNEQAQVKEQIIAERIDSFLEGQRTALARMVNGLREEVQQGRKLLETGDLHSLSYKEKEISKRLKSGQKAITVVFEEEISKIRQRLSLLMTEMKEISVRFGQIEVKSESKVETYEVSTSKWYKPWTWGSSETRSRTVTYRYADTHEAIGQVERYLGDGERKIKEEIITLINLPALKKAISEAVMKLFDLSDPNLDPENDILLPIRSAVAKIIVPEVKLGETDFTKEITSQFSSGRVDEYRIEALRAAQKQAVISVLKSLESAVRTEEKRIVETLEKTRKEFVDDLISDITAGLEKLRKELAEKEATMQRYEKLHKLLASEG